MYFTFDELVRTNCGLPNLPKDLDHVRNLLCLSEFLNDIRIQFGEPIYVNSAYRTSDVNKRVGGVANSFHCIGRAADIRPSYMPSIEYKQNLQRLIDVLKTKEDQLVEFIPYPTYIHIAV